MRNNGCFIIALLFFCFRASAQPAVDKAVELFNKRHEKAKGLQADSTVINQCISAFEAEIKKGNVSEKCALYYLRSLNFKARFVLGSEKDKRKLLDKAVPLTETYCQKFPLSAALLFENITSVGLRAELTGIMANATNGVVEKMHSTTLHVIKLDSMFAECTGFRVLGILNYKTPYVPLVMTWPDKKGALRLLEKALKHFPADIPNNFYYAEALLENKETTKARVYFNLVLKLKGRETEVLEDLDFRIKAGDYLKNL
ncbi:MAG: tetratricopeptide repeat protein [Bacteroidia bacterium]